jgi:hypothetical protein
MQKDSLIYHSCENGVYGIKIIDITLNRRTNELPLASGNRPKLCLN